MQPVIGILTDHPLESLFAHSERVDRSILLALQLLRDELLGGLDVLLELLMRETAANREVVFVGQPFSLAAAADADNGLHNFASAVLRASVCCRDVFVAKLSGNLASD